MEKRIISSDPSSRAMRDMLSKAGYADKALDFYLEKKHMGSLPDADQVSSVTGDCGDTMTVYLDIKDGRVRDSKMEVMGCPGAVASAMAAMEMIQGKKLEDIRDIRDGDLFQELGNLPDDKQDCVRLAVKTLRQALDDYGAKNPEKEKNL